MKNQYTQMIRGLLIICVIMIHSITESNGSLENYILIIIRQICNIAVPSFFFLSGYYTKQDKIKDFKYTRKRIISLGVPLLVWNFIYFVFNKCSTKQLLSFGTAAHLYFIVVLLQLVILTPLIYKIKNKKISYIITPTYLLLYRIILLKYNIEIPLHQYWFVAWIIYFQLGILYKDYKINKKRKGFIYLYLFSLILEIIYQFQMANFYNFSMALSQMNIINMITSILFFNYIVEKMNNNVNKENLLSKIGDCSLGIFYIHILVLRIVKHFITMLIKNIFISVIVSSVVTLIISFYIVIVSHKILPDKVNRIIGF